MPAPLRCTSTTSLFALSTLPEPMGQPIPRVIWTAHRGSGFGTQVKFLLHQWAGDSALPTTSGVGAPVLVPGA